MDTKQFFRLAGFSYEKYQTTREQLTQGKFNHAKLALKIIIDRAGDLEVPQEIIDQYSIATNGVLAQKLNSIANALDSIEGKLEMYTIDNLGREIVSAQLDVEDPNANVLYDLKEKFDKIATTYRVSTEIREYLASSLDELGPKLKFDGGIVVADFIRSKDTMERLERILNHPFSPTTPEIRNRYSDISIAYQTGMGLIRENGLASSDN